MPIGGLYNNLDDERIRSEFYQRVGQTFAGSWASDVSFFQNSNTAIERFDWLGQAPGLSARHGEIIEDQLNKFSYTLENVEYNSLISPKKADIRRDKTGQILIRVGDLGVKAGLHWEQLFSSLILTNGTGYDGKAFFSSTHNESGSNQTNLITSTQAPGLNIAAPTAPTAIEASAALLDSIGHMLTFTDDKGDDVNGQQRSFTVHAPTPAIWGAMTSAVSDTNLAGGQTNTLTNIPMKINVVLNNALSSVTDGFYLFATDGIMKPFIMQEEVPLNFWSRDPGEEYTYVKFGANATRAAGYGLWNMASKMYIQLNPSLHSLTAMQTI